MSISPYKNRNRLHIFLHPSLKNTLFWTWSFFKAPALEAPPPSRMRPAAPAPAAHPTHPATIPFPNTNLEQYERDAGSSTTAPLSSFLSIVLRYLCICLKIEMPPKRRASDSLAADELHVQDSRNADSPHQSHSSNNASQSLTPSPASTVPLELDFESLNDYHIRVLSSDTLLQSLRVIDDGANKTVRCSLPLLQNGTRYQGDLFAYLDTRCLLFHDAKRCKTLAYLRVSDILQHFAEILFHVNGAASSLEGLNVKEIRCCFMRMNYLHDSIIR
jgi:hypothetical protein